MTSQNEDLRSQHGDLLSGNYYSLPWMLHSVIILFSWESMVSPIFWIGICAWYSLMVSGTHPSRTQRMWLNNILDLCKCASTTIVHEVADIRILYIHPYGPYIITYIYIHSVYIDIYICIHVHRHTFIHSYISKLTVKLVYMEDPDAGIP